MIYLKKIIRKMNKYIKNKNERKYQKLKVCILKNIKQEMLETIKKKFTYQIITKIFSY